MPIVARGRDGGIALDEANRSIEGRLESLCRLRAAFVVPCQGRLVLCFGSRMDGDFNHQLDPSLSLERGP